MLLSGTLACSDAVLDSRRSWRQLHSTILRPESGPPSAKPETLRTWKELKAIEVKGVEMRSRTGRLSAWQETSATSSTSFAWRGHSFGRPAARPRRPVDAEYVAARRQSIFTLVSFILSARSFKSTDAHRRIGLAPVFLFGVWCSKIPTASEQPSATRDTARILGK